MGASVLTDTAADPATTVDHSRETSCFCQKKEGNTTVTTSVTTDLEDAKTSAVKRGRSRRNYLKHIHPRGVLLATIKLNPKEINTVVSVIRGKESHKKM